MTNHIPDNTSIKNHHRQVTIINPAKAGYTPAMLAMIKIAPNTSMQQRFERIVVAESWVMMRHKFLGDDDFMLAVHG